MTTISSLRIDEILSILGPVLSAKPYVPDDSAKATPSAVLVLIHYHRTSGRPHVFLTKRSAGLKTHGGEISFPGGRFAKSDESLLATALRETQEEIGISVRPEQIAGSLKVVRTLTSNHFIVPFVTVQASLPEHKISPSEVDSLLDAPLIDTLRTISPDFEHYHLAAGAHTFTFEGNVIWGATARIMKQLYDLLVAK
jgi:8-oxo-dGTP pyrophosphatase MutT (NUDIX family)